MNGPVAMLLDGGRRLHLQHGPIDLVIGAEGRNAECRHKAFAAARDRFETVLQELVDELPNLRSNGSALEYDGETARRMARAIRAHADVGFVTPMITVAGAVADTVLSAMLAAGPLRRAYVNNGGDIALHLESGAEFSVAVASLENSPIGRITVQSGQKVGGLATSGLGGRSLSFGIATSVSVLATDAAAADATATLIANAVDISGHPNIHRKPASEIDPNSDLGDRRVVGKCGWLADDEIAKALHNGTIVAEEMRNKGTIVAALLHLRGQSRIVGENHFSLTSASGTADIMEGAEYA